ncbi:hypothetical protein T4D_17092 [Trichinella pseudospiralis]|uniref:Uncharacterized protein n=1 Tax=Trichinella pseudospiralis TaxID=6337 RepID=A0A0V1FBF5_TRIPS|nr:hypothetical protein T4D_17092 [Trichinella pseudospiralis]
MNVSHFLNVVNEVRNSKRKSKTDDKLQIIICRSAAMLSVLLQVGDVSLHPLILYITFTLLFQSEAMDKSVPAIENCYFNACFLYVDKMYCKSVKCLDFANNSFLSAVFCDWQVPSVSRSDHSVKFHRLLQWVDIHLQWSVICIQVPGEWLFLAQASQF